MERTGKAVKPEVTLYHPNGTQLVKGVDYTLAYKNNVKSSDRAVIVVRGKGSYSGSFNVNFSIKDKIEETEEPSGTEGDDETKPGGSEDFPYRETPVAVRCCWCGYEMPFYYFASEGPQVPYGGLMVDIEQVTWYAHTDIHLANNERTDFNDVSWEKYLKYGGDPDAFKRSDWLDD